MGRGEGVVGHARVVVLTWQRVAVVVGQSEPKHSHNVSFSTVSAFVSVSVSVCGVGRQAHGNSNWNRAPDQQQQPLTQSKSKSESEITNKQSGQRARQISERIHLTSQAQTKVLPGERVCVCAVVWSRAMAGIKRSFKIFHLTLYNTATCNSSSCLQSRLCCAYLLLLPLHKSCAKLLLLFSFSFFVLF